MGFPTQKFKSEHGAEISVNSENVLIKEPDILSHFNSTIQGSIIELSMSDIYNIAKTLQEKFGLDVLSEEFEQEFKH
ncbi:hypothetical protein KAU33_04320 [Candidatus Dependentiae bacterium]|nr:hypothetical protein [Candidatus Dependentiae bacterium]